MERIKSLRKRANLTQAQLALKMGVQQTTVSMWEGKGFPKTKMLPKLAAVLGCTVEDLISGK